MHQAENQKEKEGNLRNILEGFLHANSITYPSACSSAVDRGIILI